MLTGRSPKRRLMSLLIASAMLAGCFVYAGPVELLAATADVNALSIALDSNVGEITDGKIKVQSVTGGTGGPLYFVIATTEDTAPALNTSINTIADKDGLTLNTEIGMALSYKNYLRVYETDATGLIIGYASMPIPWNMIGTVLYRGNWEDPIANSTIKTFGEDAWKNYTIDAVITNLGQVNTANAANLMLFFRHTGTENTSGNCFYLIQTQSLIAFQSYPYNFDAYPGTGQTAVGVPNRVRIVVDGNNNQFWSTGSNGVNGTLIKRVDKTATVTSHIRPAGKVGFRTENCTAKIENYVVRRICKAGEDPYETYKTVITNPTVKTINAPQTGNYPQSLYKYSNGNGANSFTQTIEWSPAITSTFKTNTVYTATLTLRPVQATSTFQGVKLSDIIGLPTEGYTSMTADMSGDSMVIKIVFNATGSVPAQRQELFRDDFNGTSLDTTKWNAAPGWDRQGRSTWDKDYVKVENGNLILSFQKDPVLGATKTTDTARADNWIRAGAVRTRPTDNSTQMLFENSYGYYESSIKFPKIAGMWGAFWLMSPTQTANPANGVYGSEIDVLESISNQNNGFNGALYWNGYGGVTSGSVGSGSKTADMIGINIYDGDFHTFGLEWTPTEYIWYVDDVEFWRYSNSGNINQNPNYLKLSVEGASFSPPLGADSGEMVVDYVAVFNQPKHQVEESKAEDYVTLNLDPVYNTERDLWQIKAALKNIRAAGAYSGSVALTSPSGYVTQAVQNYPELSPGAEYTLYFDMNRNYISNSAKDSVTFDYTTSNEGKGSASLQFGSVPAAYTNTPVVVDGDLSEDIWQSSSEIDFSKGVSTATNVSAAGNLAWDKEYLYAAIKVANDDHIQTATNAADILNGDSIQIMVDGQELGFAKSDSNILQYKWTGPAEVIPADKAKAAIIRDEQAKTTTYEIAIKWSYLNIVGENLKNGDLHNIAMVINDNNGTERRTISYFDGILANKGEGQGSLLLLDHVVLPRYIVTFNSNGGWSIPQTEITFGSKITKPVDPKRVYGYTFAGWYADQSCTHKWNFDSDTVTGDITLYAKWDHAFTVTFNSNGGSAVAPVTDVVPGSGITASTVPPTRTGYVFDGWYSDTGLITAWDFNTGKVNANITLYAKWSIDGSRVPAQTALSLKPLIKEGAWQVEATVKNIQAFGKYSGKVYLISIDGSAKNYGPLAPGEEVKLYFDIATEYLSDTLIFDYTTADGSGTDGIGSASTSFVSALHTDTPIEPDGNLNKGVWQAVPPIDFGKARINSDSQAGNQPVKGNYDIEAAGKLAWDNEYLYVALEVDSETHYQVATSGDGIWAYDSLQLRLRQGTNSSTELGFALNSNTNEILQWCWAGPNAGKKIPADSAKTVIIRDENTHTTRYEIAVKWEFMGINGEDIQNNDLLGICLAINDYGAKISGSNIVNSRRQFTYFDGILGTKDEGLGNLLLTAYEVQPLLEKVTLSADKTALKTADTALLSISGTMSDESPADLSRAQIVYGSDNEEVATVDAYGTVTAIKEGTADIKASVTLRGITKEGSIQIIVDNTPPAFELIVDGNVLKEGNSFEDCLPLTFKVWDNLSGVASAKITIDGTDYSIDPNTMSSVVIDLAGKVGSRTVTVQAQDIAGNALEKTFRFTVTTSIGSMRHLIDRHVKAGGLGGPLKAQLNNNLDQAQHQLDIGRPDQAAKHMEAFIKHLNNDALDSNVNDNVIAVLNAEAGALIKMWVTVN